MPCCARHSLIDAKLILFLQMPSLVVARCTGNPQYKIDNDGSQQCNRQYRRSKPIVKSTLSPHPNALGPPVERDERIDHCSHCNEREETSRNLTDLVSEIK